LCLNIHRGKPGFVLVGPIIGFFLAIPFFEGSITDQLAKMSDPIVIRNFECHFMLCKALLRSLAWPCSFLVLVFVEPKESQAGLQGKKIYGLMLMATLVMTLHSWPPIRYY